MKTKEEILTFLNLGTTIHCKTIESSNKVLDVLTDLGIEWRGGGMANGERDFWQQYKENTRYDIGFFNTQNKLGFGSGSLDAQILNNMTDDEFLSLIELEYNPTYDYPKHTLLTWKKHPYKGIVASIHAFNNAAELINVIVLKDSDGDTQFIKTEVKLENMIIMDEMELGLKLKKT